MSLIEQLLGLIIQTVALFVQLLISIFTFFIVALTAVAGFLGL